MVRITPLKLKITYDEYYNKNPKKCLLCDNDYCIIVNGYINGNNDKFNICQYCFIKYDHNIIEGSTIHFHDFFFDIHDYGYK